MTDYERMVMLESQVEILQKEIRELTSLIDSLYQRLDKEIEMNFGSAYEKDIDSQVEEMFYNDESEGR